MIQEQFLNYILESKDASPITLNGLTAEFFSDYPNEFNYIKNHLQQYSVVPDKETFLNVFPNFDLIQVNEPVNYLLEELLRDKTQRFLVANYTKARELLMNGNPEAAMTLLQNAANESTSFTTLNATNLFSDISRYDTYTDKLANYDKYFIKTGFPELDKLLGGWDRNEDSVTIVARNGLGKSWVLFKCAAAAAEAGLKVGIYSGEMSHDAVGYRVDTILGHINNGAMVYGSGSIKNQYKNYLEDLAKTSQGQLWVITPKDIGGFAKPSTLKAFVEKYSLDILFVDQYSLMRDDEGSDVERLRLANISTALKLIQTTKHIPVIAVCQQNRSKLEDADKAFDTTQINGCDMIGQNSSVVIFIDRKDDLMKLYLGKLRQSGAVGKFLNYKINLNFGDWQYIPEGEEADITQEVPTDSEGNIYSSEDIFA